MKVVLTQEEHERLTQMLNGIARRYAGWGGIDFEDIEQECWLKALQVIEAYGEVPDFNIIAQSCYNRIFDLGRYQKVRVNQIPIDPCQFDWSDTDGEGGTKQGCSFDPAEGFCGRPIGSDFDSKLVIDEIENLFADDKNALEYVKMLQIYLGIKEVSPKVFNGYFGDKNLEQELALNLGFASSMSNGYRNVKRRVRRIVAEYMGWGENYNHSC